MPGEGLTHGPPAERKAGGSHHRISQIIRHSLRVGLRLIRGLPGDRLVCPRRDNALSRIALGTSTGMPGPHDFTVRVRRDRRRALHVHRSPLLRLVTIGRNAPLHRRGMAEIIRVICPTAQAHYFQCRP